MQKRDLLKTIVLFFVIIGVTVGSAILLNTVTGPKIAQDAADRKAKEEAAQLGAVGEVFPGAQGFKDITADLELVDGVSKVYEETSGQGYAFIATKTGYSQPVTVTVGVSNGVIVGIKVEVGTGDWAVDASVQSSYLGQDTNLGGVLKGGATFSEGAVNAGVKAGLQTLQNNGKLTAAKKDIDFVYTSQLSDVFSGFVAGKELTVTGNIYYAVQPLNKNAVICHVTSGEEKLLAVYNATGVVTVYKGVMVDEETQEYILEDVTAQYSSVVAEVTTFASAHVTSLYSKLETKVKLYAGYEEAADIQEVKLSVNSTVVAALSFTLNGATYYAYHAQTYSFDNHIMNTYVIVDATGAIVKLDVSQFLFEEEYFFNKPAYNESTYEGGFVGVTKPTFDNQSLISGATMSSNAVKQGVNDIFAAFASQGGNK